MGSISSPDARNFVNSVLCRYDLIYHRGSPQIDVFNPEIQPALTEAGRGQLPSHARGSEQSFSPLKSKVQQLPFHLQEYLSRSYKGMAQLFAFSGILDAPLPRPALPSYPPEKRQVVAEFNGQQSDKNGKIEALLQHILENGKYPLDPVMQVLYTVMREQAKRNGVSPPPIHEVRRHFFSHIFKKVYSISNVAHKRELIEMLKPFQDKLEERSFRMQRVLFRIEGIFIQITSNRYVGMGVKIGFTVVIGFVSFLAVKKLLALSVLFFNSPTFAQSSSVLMSQLPVVVINYSRLAYHQAIKVADYVASTQVYELMFSTPLARFMIPRFFIPQLQPIYFLYSLICWPTWTVAQLVCFASYQRLFGPDARVQEAIARSLEGLENRAEAHELLAEGMKAYQVWMYLVEQGPQKGLFHEKDSKDSMKVLWKDTLEELKKSSNPPPDVAPTEDAARKAWEAQKQTHESWQKIFDRVEKEGQEPNT